MEQSLQSLFEDDDGVGTRLYGEHYKMIREMGRHTPPPVSPDQRGDQTAGKSP
jgi:hypothetical protein